MSDPTSRWRVHKFGGSSVADAACMQRVAAILEEDPRAAPGRRAVRRRGVTDALLNLIAAAERQEGTSTTASRRSAIATSSIATALLDPRGSRIHPRARRRLRDIASILHAVRLTAAASGETRDLVAGFGEIWSTRLFARYLAGRGEAEGRALG